MELSWPGMLNRFACEGEKHGSEKGNRADEELALFFGNIEKEDSIVNNYSREGED